MRTALATLVISAVAVSMMTASCSSNSAAPASESATLACTDAALTEPVKAALSKDETLRQINGMECLDGWAVVNPTIGPADGSTDGEIDITLVFKADGGAWVDQDRTAVCGTLPLGDGSPTYPSDAKVPAGIWRAACQTN